MDRQDLAAFAGEITHELRSPLTVISGEIELALSRDRSPAAYREVLTRLAERVAELIDLTSDVAILGEVDEFPELHTGTVSLDAVFAALADRFGARRGTPVTLEAASSPQHVKPDVTPITSALSLLIEHALRHRRDGSRVRVRALTSKDTTTDSGTTELVIDALPGGFSNSSWHGLAKGADTSQPAQGPRHLRLETAARIIQGCAGSLELVGAGGGDECVRVRLPLAAAPSDDAEGIR
jgi:signal transduction histidine kinase